MVDQFEPVYDQDEAVIALLASLTRRSSVMRFEAMTELVARLNAECRYLPARS